MRRKRESEAADSLFAAAEHFHGIQAWLNPRTARRPVSGRMLSVRAFVAVRA